MRVMRRKGKKKEEEQMFEPVISTEPTSGDALAGYQ